MFDNYGIHEGVYRVQQGFRKQTALIHCPYISNKIELIDQSINVLDGAEVYWREVRRFYVFKKNSNKKQMIINAALVGHKHCKYITEGINIICTLHIQNSEQGKVIYANPLNNKLPKLEIVDQEGFPAGYDGDFFNWQNFQHFYFWVRIYCWNYEEKYPKAFVTGIFNQVKTTEAETEAMLHSLDIEQKEILMNFDKSMLPTQYLPIRNHQTFQDIVFSIDPQGSIDMEDALSLKKLNEDTFEVGIHIADVSSFMHLVNRRQISMRGSSIYLPHKTIHLFPEEITKFCSFQQKKKRLAFSVFLVMNKQGTILSTEFKKTIIQNTAQMSYKQAQGILDESVKNKEEFKMKHALCEEQACEIFEKLKILQKMALNRRKIRNSQEVLDRNEITFELDENKLPISIGIKKRFESEKLIQEFMIAANGEVARKIVNDYGSSALIIHHPKPSEYGINNLNSFASYFGVQFNPDSFNSLQTEMKKLFEKGMIKDEFKEALLMKAIQIQEVAIYTRHMNSQKGHYGLNMEYYTHFTSPLRRFADIVVHEQLDHCLREGTHPKYNPRLDQQIEFMNRIRIRNKKMKQLVIECFFNLYLFQQKKEIKAKALIMSLGLKSVCVYIPLYNLLKEVQWKSEVTVGSVKEGIKIKKEREEWVFKKNDSLDVEIKADIHQQVKISLLLKDNEENIIKI